MSAPSSAEVFPIVFTACSAIKDQSSFYDSTCPLLWVRRESRTVYTTCIFLGHDLDFVPIVFTFVCYELQQPLYPRRDGCSRSVRAFQSPGQAQQGDALYTVGIRKSCGGRRGVRRAAKSPRRARRVDRSDQKKMQMQIGKSSPKTAIFRANKISQLLCFLHNLS